MAAKSYQENGHFVRPESSFRNFVSPDPDSPFPAEKGRYALYVAVVCPWAHRTLIVRALKGLEDIIDVYPVHPAMGPQGWYFSGEQGSLPADPLYGFHTLRELYHKADPNFEGRFTVPVLWDKKKHTIVNNESSEIIVMLTSAFDHLLPEHLRESSKGDNGAAGLYPPALRRQIDELNEWVYTAVNNGVYKTGFATSQEAYEGALYPLFDGLDRIEGILSDGRRYLFGEHITLADVRLYVTIARFDVAYHPGFLCNLKSVRHDYPKLHLWFRRLYWDGDEEGPLRGAFRRTTGPNIHLYLPGYARGRYSVVFKREGPLIVPKGPKVLVEPLGAEEA